MIMSQSEEIRTWIEEEEKITHLGKPPPTKTYEFSEKFQRGGGVISNPKIFVANFGLLNRVFLA